jgi:hypothetical protein
MHVRWFTSLPLKIRMGAEQPTFIELASASCPHIVSPPSYRLVSEVFSAAEPGQEKITSVAYISISQEE